MRALFLDYQRKTPAVTHAFRWTVFAAGALVSAFAIHTLTDVNAELARLEMERARLERKSVPVARGRVPAQDAMTSEEIKAASLIAEQLTFPWPDLLAAIESGAGKQIALLSLQPDVSRRLMRIIAEARNKEDMLAYVRRLSGDRRLSNVHVIDHQIQDKTPGTPVRFSMQASWAGNTNEIR